MPIAVNSGNASQKGPARDRRGKRSTELGHLTDELRLNFRQDINGRLFIKAASAHLGKDERGRLNVPYDTLKSFLTGVYVQCPLPKFLRAVARCSFVSDRTREIAKILLAHRTGEYGVEFLSSRRSDEMSV